MNVFSPLQKAFVSKDSVEVAALFDELLVTIGTAPENLDRAQSDEYVTRIFNQPGTVRWG